jgi:kynureninase
MSNKAAANPRFETSEAFARRLDADDPLAKYRERFHLPPGPGGQPLIYFAGNSLGLQPRSVEPAVRQELEDWARLAVDAHFEGRAPWYSYHEVFRESGARLVGGVPGEVVYMNGLTVNLHLMMVSFYRPSAARFRILIEDSAFPSDLYAVRTQLRWHGIDPAAGLLVARPREGEHTLRTEDVVELLAREGSSVALVLMSAVNYFSGQLFDIERITAAARKAGCIVGWDLAHAAGNVPLRLHDWNVDFACWCTYKYLNCGPGSVAGCFIHQRHARNAELPRFGGWWGNDPGTRFRMHLNDKFVPVASAEAWQLSNPPILSMAALKASLDIFDEVGMAALREKSLKLTAYLEFLLAETLRSSGGPRRYEIITPADPAQRGCQLSILVHDRPREMHRALQSAGVIGDFRPPNVVRLAPVPLYNTFREVWNVSRVLAEQTL